MNRILFLTKFYLALLVALLVAFLATFLLLTGPAAASTGGVFVSPSGVDVPTAGLTSCTSGVHGVQAEGKAARNHRNNVPRVTSLSPSVRVSTKLYTPLGASRPAASRPSQGMD